MTRRHWWLIIIMAFLLVAQIISIPRSFTNTSLIPALEVVAGVLWSGAMAVMLFSLIRKSVGWWGMLLFLTAYAAYYVLHLALFARADYDRGRLPFLITLLTVLIVFDLMILILRQKRR